MTQIRTTILRFAACSLLAVLLFASLASAQATRVEELEYPALPEFKVPQPSRYELANGLVVMLLEDHELPLVNAQVLVKTGSRLEPADKIGLAGLVGQMMRSGGTQKLASDELDDLLEDRAARIETFIGTSTGNASLSCLKDDLPEILVVLADVLRIPAFEEDKLAVAKNQLISGISRQNDNAGGILSRESQEIRYGADSPYTRIPTYASSGSIVRNDLMAFHGRYYHPDQMILGLVGDFDSKTVKKLIEQTFGNWPQGPQIQQPAAPYRQNANPGIFYIEKNDVTQSNIWIGHPGILRSNPHYFEIEVMNQIFGGSFASRLFSNVRSKKGLAYSVRGGVGSRWDYEGTFSMRLSTKTETTAAAIDALIEEARNLVDKAPSNEEVAKAKTSILNSFVFRSDSTAEILRQQMVYEYYGYPLDWLSSYRTGIEQVTADQVRAAANTYVRPEDFSILVVGPKEGLDRPLSDFGTVQIVDITIPEPEAEAVETTAEGMARGRELLTKAVATIGGGERLAGLKTLSVKAANSLTTPQGEMSMAVESVVVLPNQMRAQITLPMGTMTRILNGDKGMMEMAGRRQGLPESQVADLKKSLNRQLLILLSHHDSLTANASGTAKVGDSSVELVHVEFDGDTTILGIEPESGRVLSLTHQGTGMGSTPGEIHQVNSDFREIDGFELAFKIVVTFNGEPMMTSILESAVINGPVAEDTFAIE